MASVTLSAETQALLDEAMDRGRFTDTDQVLRLALETLRESRGEDYEDLNEETRAAIEEGADEIAQGLGRPWQQVREELRAKYISG